MRRATVRYIWDRMMVGLWFVPLVMALAAFCLSWLIGRLCDNASVLLHMLKAIEIIGREMKTFVARQELLRYVHLVQAESLVGALVEPDKHRIRLRCEMVETNLVTARR